jgi:hypothetical protein
MSGAYIRADSAAKVVGERDASGAVAVAVHVEVDGLRPCTWRWTACGRGRERAFGAGS